MSLCGLANLCIHVFIGNDAVNTREPTPQFRTLAITYTCLHTRPHGARAERLGGGREVVR